MTCLNCGEETQGGQVFCKKCLEAMEAFPVSPDTVIQLPKQPSSTPAPRRRAATPEETIHRLQTWVHRLAWLSFVLVIALALCCIMLFA